MVERVSADQLEALLAASPAGSVVVIDVRDEDFEGGNIRGAINVPSEAFTRRIGELQKKTADSETIVFHCMFSQQRGPYCASTFYQHITAAHPERSVRIMVLVGGYRGFKRRFLASRSELFENVSISSGEDDD